MGRDKVWLCLALPLSTALNLSSKPVPDNMFSSYSLSGSKVTKRRWSRRIEKLPLLITQTALNVWFSAVDLLPDDIIFIAEVLPYPSPEFQIKSTGTNVQTIKKYYIYF